MTREWERYVLRGGKSGYDRLQILARIREPDTRALLARAGVSPGMRCIDLGCGGGAVTLLLAQRVGPGGSVVGVDMDPLTLELARTAATERGVTWVEFREQALGEWSEREGYDVVYSRFVLQHLERPLDTLRRMWGAVRPGGLLIVEDADFDGCVCYPPNAGLTFFLRSYAEVLARRGGDHTLGRKLFTYFLELGIPEPDVHLISALYNRGEARGMALNTLEASSEAIVSQGIATHAEVEKGMAQLRDATDDPRTLIVAPRVFQVFARK